jgi:hypothetical protein
MILAEGLTIAAAALVLLSEFKNFKRDEILSAFVKEAHVIGDRLDAVERVLLKLLER